MLPFFLFVFTCTIIEKCSLLVEMTKKFNKDMYARMRNKKDEPLSALATKSVRIMDRSAPFFPDFRTNRGGVTNPVG